MFSNLLKKKELKENFFGEYFPSKAPNKKQISYRALCLGAVLLRNEYELYKNKQISDPLIPITNAFPNQLVEWYTKEEIVNFFSNNERELLNKPYGEWSNQERKNISWRNQSLGTLLWALSLYDEIPEIPDGFRLEKNLIRKLQILHTTKDFLKKTKLRSTEEIRRERDIAENWHWRTRKGIHHIPDDTSKDEFTIKGKRFNELTNDEYNLISSIVMERHLALNWLCGYSKNWDDTPTDT